MLRKKLSLGLLLLAFAACTKEKIVEVEKEKIVEVDKPAAANISITSPKPGDVFAHGDTVHIKALLTGVNTLHGYEISIRNTDDEDAVVYLKSVHDHNKVINVDTYWINTESDSGSRSVNIVTAIDHDGNSLGKKVAFKVK
ncbi:MAG: hypothetical protein EOP53_07565 [Sphingobacteriales bacterium]|nr:MAG: hypothetical protein EOP53_07565 [Sphingobacteriales bacterium]